MLAETLMKKKLDIRYWYMIKILKEWILILQTNVYAITKRAKTGLRNREVQIYML